MNPFAVELLKKHKLDTAGLRSKSWDEFAKPDAPRMDLVVTVCDSAAGETCPLWPGKPDRAHWGVADPAAAGGSDDDKRRAFLSAFAELSAHIDQLLALPIDK